MDLMDTQVCYHSGNFLFLIFKVKVSTLKLSLKEKNIPRKLSVYHKMFMFIQHSDLLLTFEATKTEGVLTEAGFIHAGQPSSTKKEVKRKG